MSYHLDMATLDPILPLPVGTGLPEVRQGEGKTILQNDGPSESGMTNRAFFVVWEQVERRAAENYPKYVGGTMDAAAQAWLEAVVWFRRKAYPGMDIDPISETEAQKIRAKEAVKAKTKKKDSSVAAEQPDASEGAKSSTAPVRSCPECGDTELIKTKTKKGKLIWKCFECDHRWPREAPESSSKALDSPNSTRKTGKSSEKPRKGKEKGKKNKKKART